MATRTNLISGTTTPGLIHGRATARRATANPITPWSRIVVAALIACVFMLDRVDADLNSGPPEKDTSGGPVLFEKAVRPILQAYCWKCHGSDGRQSELDMRTLPLILRGSKNGPVVVPGKADESLLLQKIISGDMPRGNLLHPTAEHIEIIRRWIDEGAHAEYAEVEPIGDPGFSDERRGWWAFRPLSCPPVPRVADSSRLRTPVDAFALRRLEEKELGFSADADRTTLLRRVSFDLVGLPPAPAEVEAFLNDTSPDAYSKLVDNLLASPHHGERWGRHWLDAAGYVDSSGLDNDAAIIYFFENMWKYRDYVVRSFNIDKPYDLFLHEQIAGDELVDWRNAPSMTPEMQEKLVATGFLRHAPDCTDQAVLNTGEIRHQILYDTVQIFSTNVLGLTFQCARCHDHKFDPISQAEYFRLAALFMPALNVYDWKALPARHLPDISPLQRRELEAHNASLETQAQAIDGKLAELREPTRQALFAKKLETVPEPIRGDTAAAVATPEDQRTEIQKYLAGKFGEALTIMPPEIDAALDKDELDSDLLKRAKDLAHQAGALRGQKRGFGKIQALWEDGAPPPTYLYRRGDFGQPGAEVKPGIPVVFEELGSPFELRPPDSGTASSGRRSSLARWLTRSNHPLTARVIVNRVWQHYFGVGLVSTPDNFGISGMPPTHPQLLDWLSSEFVKSGWSFKRLHRLIVTSTVYRQASRRDPEEEQRPRRIDPDNQLLWRMRYRRLESEIIRDRILATSGALEGHIGGTPLPHLVSPSGKVTIDNQRLPPGSTEHRRSLYVFSRRNYHLSALNVFDQPLVAHNCTQRTTSAVVLQSLTMLNSAFVFDQAAIFAERVRETVARELTGGSPDDARIFRAFRLAFSRAPDADEFSAARDLLASQARLFQAEKSLDLSQASDAALTELCHMLFNANEFLYLE